MEIDKIIKYDVSDDNILTFFTDKQFVYSTKHNRIFKKVGIINYHDLECDDNIPTILVDRDGGMFDFLSLLATQTFEVTKLPKGFNYIKYSKEL